MPTSIEYLAVHMVNFIYLYTILNEKRVNAFPL